MDYKSLKLTVEAHDILKKYCDDNYLKIADYVSFLIVDSIGKLTKKGENKMENNEKSLAGQLLSKVLEEYLATHQFETFNMSELMTFVRDHINMDMFEHLEFIFDNVTIRDIDNVMFGQAYFRAVGMEKIRVLHITIFPVRTEIKEVTTDKSTVGRYSSSDLDITKDINLLDARTLNPELKIAGTSFKRIHEIFKKSMVAKEPISREFIKQDTIPELSNEIFDSAPGDGYEFVIGETGGLSLKEK
jgi:hypothetical protein